MGPSSRPNSPTQPVSDRGAPSPHEAGEKNPPQGSILPTHNGHGYPIFRVASSGESGRRGVNPVRFFKVCFKSTTSVSMAVNVLWPFVPAAIALHFARPDLHIWVFILNYVATVPTANLLGFAGGELARKLPKVLGVLTETT